MPSARFRIAIISPGTADANNGNWRTAARWQRFLASRHVVSIGSEWPGSTNEAPPDLFIALHAERSAESLARFAASHPDRPTIVVLTGTDLYPSLTTDATSRDALARATRIVVLQPEAMEALPASMRAKAESIVQSAPTLRRRAPDPRTFDLVMVGHMRAVKDPGTAWRAFQRVARGDQSIRLIHIGDALEPSYRDQALALAANYRNFRWLGPMSHAMTRQQIRRARVLVIPSIAEGGANVVVEAVTSATPVLASAIPGNLGLLGRGYAGTFPAGDDVALATLIERVRHNRDFLSLLTRQCADRAPLFRPEHERERLSALVASCLASSGPSPT